MMKSSSTLNQRLRMLGLTVSFEDPMPAFDLEKFDLERDIVSAIIESREDRRLMALLSIWFEKHADQVIIDKFFKMINLSQEIAEDDPLLLFYMAKAVYGKHSKWKKFIKNHHRIYPIDKDEIKSAVQIRGMDEAMEVLGVIVPKGFLKTSSDKVYSSSDLAKINPQFRNRLIIGPNLRADIITAIECGASNPFQLSRSLGCNYESAYRVMKEYKAAFEAA